MTDSVWPEQIVQVAADPLALGDPRHLLDRLLRHAQLGVLAPELGEVDVGRRRRRRRRRGPASKTQSGQRRATSASTV